jgi:very-short-patch-repair endonuclease
MSVDRYDGFARLLSAAGVPPFEREYRFHAARRWRLDFAWPQHRLGLEIEGVTVAGGRHQRIAGFRKDMEKYNALALAGWSLLRVTPADVRTGRAVLLVLEWFRKARTTAKPGSQFAEMTGRREG